MDQQQCLGLTNSNLASSPIPVIGVYIAISSFVCLLFLICDVVRGFHKNKPIIPCKFFSLNSLTLTLLGVSTKLTVDLTSSMPRGIDQLSKLCGSIFITMSMGFFSPCLADMEGFELLGNMASLTILVVTVIVNISIEMSTGVILSSYTVEHVLAMTLMLLTLIVLWYISFVREWMMGSLKQIRTAGLKEYGQSDEEIYTNAEELKAFCANAYMCGPQFALCTLTNYVPYVGMLCLLSLFIVLEACFRVFFLKNMRISTGESDYKWSMWAVVITQIFTLVTGTLAIAYRSVFVLRLSYSSIFSNKVNHQNQHNESRHWNRQTFLNLILLGPFAKEFATIQDFILLARTICLQGIHYLPLSLSKFSVLKFIQVLEKPVIYLFFITFWIMAWADYMIKAAFWCVTMPIPSLRNRGDENLVFHSFKMKVREHVEVFHGKCRKDQPHFLLQLLSNTQPSPESSFVDKESSCCLLLVLLVRIANVMIPSNLAEPLIAALNEIFEVLYFIDQESTPSDSHNNMNKKCAKELWMRRDLSNHWFQKNFILYLQKRYPQADMFRSQVAVDMMQEFTALLSDNAVLDAGRGSDRLSGILCEVTPNTTAEEISGRIKQLFVDILCFLLPRLPSVLADYICKSPDSEFERRARTTLKFASKYESLKLHVKWMSPDNTFVNKAVEGRDQADETSYEAKESVLESEVVHWDNIIQVDIQ